jgi:hypothetical protein
MPAISPIRRLQRPRTNGWGFCRQIGALTKLLVQLHGSLAD